MNGTCDSTSDDDFAFGFTMAGVSPVGSGMQGGMHDDDHTGSAVQRCCRHRT